MLDAEDAGTQPRAFRIGPDKGQHVDSRAAQGGDVREASKRRSDDDRAEPGLALRRHAGSAGSGG
jgi:hypothetical protein